MPGLVPGIHAFLVRQRKKDVDGRVVKLVLGPAYGRTRGPGHDG
jgi:hypothetical protein